MSSHSPQRYQSVIDLSSQKVYFPKCQSIVLKLTQHCFYTCLMHACKTITIQHCGFMWTLRSTSVPVTEDFRYLSRVKNSHIRLPLISVPSISLSGNTHSYLDSNSDKMRISHKTHAHVTRCCYVSAGAGGLTVRHSLPPTEQAWLSLSFTTSLIDLLIIFLTGDHPVGDQRPSLYPSLCRSVEPITMFAYSYFLVHIQ